MSQSTWDSYSGAIIYEAESSNEDVFCLSLMRFQWQCNVSVICLTIYGNLSKLMSFPMVMEDSDIKLDDTETIYLKELF